MCDVAGDANLPDERLAARAGVPTSTGISCGEGGGLFVAKTEIAPRGGLVSCSRDVGLGATRRIGLRSAPAGDKAPELRADKCCFPSNETSGVKFLRLYAFAAGHRAI